MPMKSFFFILFAGLILSVGNGFRMSLGIYVPDLLASTIFGASMIGLTYGIFNLLWATKDQSKWFETKNVCWEHEQLEGPI